MMMRRRDSLEFDGRRSSGPMAAGLRALLPIGASALIALLAGCGDVAPPKPRAALYEIRLHGPLQESPETGLFSGGTLTHHQLLEKLEELRQDKDARGLLLHVPELGGAYARTAELRRALDAIREAGKPVHCYVEVSDNLGYALMASACDRISMTPTGLLNVVGVAAEAVYARDFLESLGLRADLMQVGRFKGAADPFTRQDMPPEVQETMGAMLDDLHSVLVDALASGRKVPAESVQALIDAGPYTASDARSAGLIDDVGYDDEAREHARVASKAERVTKLALEAEHEDVGLFDILDALASDPKQTTPSGQRIVLANLEGTIARGSESSTRSAHAEPFVAAMNKFADDARVKAVVLRIDSPGGSATASDLMWHAVRRVVAHKPVIVSVGDMAASGGYWIASAGTKILADDHSLIGSIGVVGGKIVAEDLTERAGVSVTRIARGKRAGWLSAMRAFNDDERAAFTRSLEQTYRQFIRRIALGRDMTAEQIAPMAEGRLMTGARARAGGLVDQAGGLREALALAREQAKLPDDVRVQVWPSQPTLMQQIAELRGGADVRAMGLAHALSLAGVERASGLIETLILGDDSHIAALPYLLRIR